MSMINNNTSIIDEEQIEKILEKTGSTSKEDLTRIINTARSLKGLSLEETAALISCDDPDILNQIFDTARYVKETIYGSRLVLFAPLYVSNKCSNDCAYCAFRRTNTHMKRRTLSLDEIKTETETLISQGHKRLLLVSGEASPDAGIDYILNAVKTVYGVRTDKGEIRRLNVNIAPTSVENYKKLKELSIGTYQIFQETYHPSTYEQVHCGGSKRNYQYRLEAVDRAFQAGIDDVGIGVLFGLYDYRFEILALMQHIAHLENTYGVGPHTISVPRLEPADGAPLSLTPPYPVDDRDFLKIIAVLRLAVPYTGIILSTRETAEIRRDAFSLGVSQISAGSRTNPGGYAENSRDELQAQFSLGDHREMDEVIRDIASLGYMPSMCTACYRLGRTGHDFMDLAKPGLIKYHCGLNALSTFLEYLIDFASPETREVGEKLLQNALDAAPDAEWKKTAGEMLQKVRDGKRDCFI